MMHVQGSHVAHVQGSHVAHVQGSHVAHVQGSHVAHASESSYSLPHTRVRAYVLLPTWVCRCVYSSAAVYVCLLTYIYCCLCVPTPVCVCLESRSTLMGRRPFSGNTRHPTQGTRVTATVCYSASRDMSERAPLRDMYDACIMLAPANSTSDPPSNVGRFWKRAFCL